MTLVLAVPPEEQPVTLDQAKRHLRVEHADDDDLIKGLIAAAVQWIDGADGWLGRALLPQTWELRLGCFDLDGLWLPLRPLRSVASVHFVTPAGDVGEMPADDYEVTGVGSSDPGRVRAVGVWPSVARGPEVIRVRYVVGYDEPAADERLAGPVPQPIVQALLLLIGHWYDRRSPTTDGGTVTELPFAVNALLTPFRVYS